MLDVKKIRQDFPILQKLINGKPLIYLDSAASSLKPQIVLDSMDQYYRGYGVNIFRGIYKISQKATDKYEEARKKVTNFIGAADSREIIFTRNATESLNLIASTWGKKNIDKNSEIVTTVMEHHANFVPWQQLAVQTGAAIKYWDMVSNLEEIVTKKTKLFAITSVSNVLGIINPIKEIVTTVRKINPDCLVVIDGAQAVPHLKVNVIDLGCDFYAFSGHKMLGPTGIGVLWGKYELLETMPPYQMGGEMIADVTLEKTTFTTPPLKFEAGTPNIAGAIGLGAAIDYLEKTGLEKIRQHEKELTAYALNNLKNLSDLEIYGPEKAAERSGVIAFNLKGVHAHDLAQILDEDNICIRSGHHCAMPLHTSLGIGSSARASFYLYNTKEEIDQLIKGIEKTEWIFTKK